MQAGVDEITEIAWVLDDDSSRKFFVAHERLPHRWVLENTDYLTRILPAPKTPLRHVLAALAVDCGRLAPPPDTIYLVGACPGFDDRFLRAALGEEPPYNYHVICCEVFACGYLGWDAPRSLKEYRAALGLAGVNAAPHTAEGDAREAKLIFQTVLARGRDGSYDAGAAACPPL